MNEPEASLLVVDDSEANRDMLSRRLRKSGYAVTAADGGRAALDLLRNNRYDLVILDLMMPDVGGLEVLQDLRRTWSPADLPVIIATARDERENVVEGFKAGASDYVTKPIDYSVVLARIQGQLALKRAVDQIRRLEADLQRRNQQLAQANERMRRDLAAAASIQTALLPATLPRDARARFAWFLKPSTELAGDTLNVFALDEDHVALYVLDVVGHGVAAALLSVAVSRMLSAAPDSFIVRRDREGAARFLGPVEVAEELDRRFRWDPATEQFFTLLYGVLDLRAREFRYVSAGHPGPLLLGRGADAPRPLPITPGLPIGLGDGEPRRDRAIGLAAGDRLYLYSDGVSEAFDPEGRPFGLPRILETLAAAQALPLETGAVSLWNAVRGWRGSDALDDDASLVAAELLG